MVAKKTLKSTSADAAATGGSNTNTRRTQKYKKILESSSADAAVSVGNKGTTQRTLLREHQTEASFREEIVHLWTKNFISPEFARFAWLESMERDLHQLRVNMRSMDDIVIRKRKKPMTVDSDIKPTEDSK